MSAFHQIDPVDPNAPPANPTAPAEKNKAWIFKCGPFSWMADMSLYRMYVQLVSFDIGERGWGGSTSL